MPEKTNLTGGDGLFPENVAKREMPEKAQAVKDAIIVGQLQGRVEALEALTLNLSEQVKVLSESE